MSRIPASLRKSVSASSSDFLGLVAEKLKATEDLISENLRSEVPFVEDSGAYIFSGGGKRMRPALLLLVAQMLGQDGQEEVTYAATIEFIHTATLIHDDMIDQASLRRGKPAVHRVWGNNQTVLLGDWLYTTAMQMALSHERLEVVQRLCHATLKMIEGELLGEKRLGALDLGRDEYFQIIELKTAHLFEAAASIPACIGPYDEERDRKLQSYGHALGVCFQLVDDLLDYTGQESEVGKPVLSDLKEGKLTLPLILLLPRIEDSKRRLVKRVLEDRSFERTDSEQILELVEREGTLDECLEIAQDYGAQAKLALDGMPSGRARRALQLAPDFVLHRRS